MKLNNQKQQDYTRNACSIYSLVDIVQLQYGVKLETDYIIKMCEYFERLWKWSSISWAVFKVIFEAFVVAINFKLWLKFKVVNSSISSLIEWDTKTWAIWMPAIKKDWYNLVKDGVFTEEEWKVLFSSKNKSFWHSMVWDNGYISDHFGNIVKCDLETMKKLVTMWVLWDMIRTIEPVWDYSIDICKRSIQIVKNRKASWWKDPFLSLEEFKDLFLNK